MKTQTDPKGSDAHLSTMENIGIKVWEIPIKLNLYLLDAYALKKYGTSYVDSKSKVNDDIRKLSETKKTHKLSDMKLLITAELLGKQTKDSLLKRYGLK